MRSHHTSNMTEGSITPLLLRFAVPMLIGNLVQQTYSLTDSIILGQYLGASALASVGATGSATSLFLSFFSGLAGGCGVTAAQSYGAGDPARTKRAIANSAYVMLCAAIITSIVTFLITPSVLQLMNTHPDILPDAIVYLRMFCLGVPLTALTNYVSAMLRALGNSRTPLYFQGASCILNIVLDLYFVCVLKMGVFGAALATLIAHLFTGLGSLLYALKCNPYFRLDRPSLKPDPALIGRAVRIGLPLALQWSLIAVSSAALQVFVNSFGDTNIVAAFTATERIEKLLHQPYNSISAALTTFAGQNYGAGNTRRVHRGLKHGFVIAAVFTLVMFMIFQLFSDRIMRLFVKEEAVITLGAKALTLTSWFYIFLALIYISRGTLNGVGDALFSLINGVVEVICRIGLPMLTMLIPGLLFWGIWWTAGLTWTISALFCMLRYFSWYRKTKTQQALPGQACAGS